MKKISGPFSGKILDGVIDLLQINLEKIEQQLHSAADEQIVHLMEKRRVHLSLLEHYQKLFDLYLSGVEIKHCLKCGFNGKKKILSYDL
jgi:hypothetical protein